jgi:hypothetical protein
MTRGHHGFEDSINQLRDAELAATAVITKRYGGNNVFTLPSVGDGQVLLFWVSLNTLAKLPAKSLTEPSAKQETFSRRILSLPRGVCT